LGENEPLAIPFPGGALVNSQAIALGIDSANFAKLVLLALRTIGSAVILRQVP